MGQTDAKSGYLVREVVAKSAGSFVAARPTRLRVTGEIADHPVAQRLELFDAARLIAAITIIWQHTPTSPQLVPWSIALPVFAVPFFVLGSMFLVFETVHRDPERPLLQYASARVTRIYVPFLMWTAIYFIARDAKHLLLSNEPALAIHPQLLLAGSAHHLWFLPFILVTSVAGFVLARFITRSRAGAITAAVVFALAGIIIGLTPSDLFVQSFVLNREWNMMPSVCWGIALGAIYPFISQFLARAKFLALIGAAMCAAGMALSVTRYRTILSDNLAGLGAMMIALAPFSGPTVSRIAHFGSLAYGIYLCHVLFIEGIVAIAAKVGYAQRWGLDVLVFIGATTCSILVADLLGRVRWGRWLAPR